MEAREEEVRGLRMDVPEGEGDMGGSGTGEESGLEATEQGGTEKEELAGLVERWPVELRLLRRAAGARG